MNKSVTKQMSQRKECTNKFIAPTFSFIQKNSSKCICSCRKSEHSLCKSNILGGGKNIYTKDVCWHFEQCLHIHLTLIFPSMYFRHNQLFFKKSCFLGPNIHTICKRLCRNIDSETNHMITVFNIL